MRLPPNDLKVFKVLNDFKDFCGNDKNDDSRHSLAVIMFAVIAITS